VFEAVAWILVLLGCRTVFSISTEERNLCNQEHQILFGLESREGEIGARWLTCAGDGKLINI
jgi:hypothetical protein